MNPKIAIALIMNEYRNATSKHPPIRSPHEGYAIILEELDELWQAIRKIKYYKERSKDMRTEAIQTGAMALRFLVDVIEE